MMNFRIPLYAALSAISLIGGIFLLQYLFGFSDEIRKTIHLNILFFCIGSFVTLVCVLIWFIKNIPKIEQEIEKHVKEELSNDEIV